ncbi:alpha/beta fold hydrolase [Streptococcus himalayensis]|uniref:Acyl-CoA thioester hydrolase n=1 Tax=Streptococcus himalayensis TaxID=1888195 RepID=A0A917A960_9STRE|nr:alpha/beta hydrolase [Streptococcus himalayensis]GGE32464.1 acyl-CoA thioester hydrolase [Streptococcus himalayensis]
MKFICLSGFGQKAEVWKEVASALPDHQVEVAFSYKSEEGFHSFEQWADQVYQSLQQLDQPYMLVGLSLGGLLALSMADKPLPNCQGMVLSATPYKLKGNRAYALQGLIFRVIPAFVFQKWGMNKKEVLDILKDLSTLDFSQKLAQLPLPVMVICGSKDWANLATARDLAAKIPRSRLEILAGGGHEVNRDCPQEFAALLEEMVDWVASLQV